MFGQQINNRYRAFADPRAAGQLFGFQAGLDLWRGALIPDHRDAVGLYFAYANAGADVQGLVTNDAATGYALTRTGRLILYGWSGGVYWTHYGPSGWYLDGVFQGTSYGGSASTQSANLDTDGYGLVGFPRRRLPDPAARTRTRLRAGTAGADRLAACPFRQRQ